MYYYITMSFAISKKVKYKGDKRIAIIRGGRFDKLYIVSTNNPKGKREIFIKDGFVEPLPNFDIHEKIYISGPSFSGKSYYAAMWAKNYVRKKKRDIIIISGLDEDKELDKLAKYTDVYRVAIDDTFVELTVEDMAESIVIFDDICLIPDPELKKVAQRLEDELLKGARHHDIIMLSTTHILLGGMATQSLLLEATSVVLFPQTIDRGQIMTYLQKRLRFTKRQLDKFTRIPSRWVALYKQNPYFLHEHGCYRINEIPTVGSNQ